MATLNSIWKELKSVPVSKLDDLYSIIHSLREDTKKSVTNQKQILSFAGVFAEMDQDDYNDFIKETKKNRADLFDRDSDL